MSQSEPFVSIVTPVHNGEAFLADCIESVLAQTYQNWEYVIANNCSSDGTEEIARRYAASDSRIRIVNTAKLLSAIDNHNYALGLIAPHSRYCKILHADDWLFPECISRMIEAASAQPSIGIVGAFCLAGTRVRGDGLPYPSTVVGGREIARLTLLGKTYPFWSPSSTLIRADLIRSRSQFYDPVKLHADVESMYEALQHCDFGLVHQVLIYAREHTDSQTTRAAKPLNTIIWSNLDLFVRYGPIFYPPRSFVRAYGRCSESTIRFLRKASMRGEGSRSGSITEKG